ncbi:hypothetical protein CRE_15409 [Caenorhabditis remanei]|uniref:Uncharacterized protein n=1 Tax=Caenorhabditis remanei TaxID=31234 RepID=E3MC79_CAERE|nr:hypothetical protein CRE_15409 [Caenorhabditis remanei]
MGLGHLFFSCMSHSPAIRKLQKKKLNIWRAEGNSLAYKEASAILKNLLIMEERESVESKLVEGSSKDFYKFINAKLKPTDQVSILLDGCELITDDKAKAEFFASSFAKSIPWIMVKRLLWIPYQVPK